MSEQKTTTPATKEAGTIKNFGFKDEAIKMVNKAKGFVILEVNASTFAVSTKFAKWDAKENHLNVGIIEEFDYTIKKSDDSELELSGKELIDSLIKNGYKELPPIEYDTKALAREL